MTLIECFDRTILDNIAGTLYLRPDKLVIVGDAGKTQSLPSRFSELLKKRGIQTQIQLCDTAGMTIPQIAEALTAIVVREEELVVDLTGGEEPVILAVGAILAQLGDRHHISVQKFNLLSAQAEDCDGDGQVVNGRYTPLTTDELIALHGGIIHPLTYQPSAHYTPKDIEKLWKIAAGAPRHWNNQIAVLSEFEKRSESKENLEISRSQLRAEIAGFQEKEAIFLSLMDQFVQNDIVDDRSDRNTIRYRYQSELYRHGTRKAGNVLELKVLLEARAQLENGKPYFDDCCMGVNIDWDGIVQGSALNTPQTRNEVDLVLTRGLRSLFISCKNGTIDEAELYKLHTVAERFGGPYTRKMLVATNLAQKTPSATRALMQRAQDMNILLVTDAAQLEPHEWNSLFRTAMRQ